MNKISGELEIMEQLLRKYNDSARADLIADWHILFEENEELFWEKVDSLDWWGGSGSMADYCLNNSSGESDHEKKMDNRRFRAALIIIYEGMVKAGQTHDRGKRWIEIFKQWQKEGI